MSLNHIHILKNIEGIFQEQGIKYTLYTDFDGNYDLIGNKTIKLWNYFPLSGTRLNAAVFFANEFLREYGLFMALHVLTKDVQKHIVMTNQKTGRRVEGHSLVKQDTHSFVVSYIPIQ
jgi:hypothetical protein